MDSRGRFSLSIQGYSGYFQRTYWNHYYMTYDESLDSFSSNQSFFHYRFPQPSKKMYVECLDTRYESPQNLHLRSLS
jgi:hypothetical protein